jgi:anti-anti-sigma factor
MSRLDAFPHGIPSPPGPGRDRRRAAVRAPSGGGLTAPHDALTTDGPSPDDPREAARIERFAAFRVDVRPEHERVVVSPAGDVDLATVGTVGSRMDDLAAAGFAVLVLDLRGVTFLDSMGLSLIVRQCRRTDVHVCLVDGVEPVSRLFDLTGLREDLRFLAPPEAPPPSA